jgi:phosphoribosylanthranilate isomerase
MTARVRVKICGITNWADARAAVDAGADALGFNFYAASPRYVAPADAARIIRKLPRRVYAVGVFVNMPIKDISATANAVDLGILQLHGEESTAAVANLAECFLVVKAFRVGPGWRANRLADYGAASAFLLDGFDRALRGGTGKVFNWKVARTAKRFGSIIVAGGLRPGNVAEAIRAARPWAIDVCGGVESGPRKKDAALLRQLMMEVEGAGKS